MAKLSKQRKSVRFAPEPGETAQLCLLPESKAFKCEHVGLVLTESFKGCSMVLALAPEMAVGDRIRIKVGELAPMLAEVRWVVPLEEQIQKVGFMYLQ